MTSVLAILGKALLGSVIVFAVSMLWIGVQHLFRKSEGLPPDCDVIGDTGRGCCHCTQKDSCTIKQKTE